MAKQTKYFGVVQAELDDRRKTAILRYTERKADPVMDKARGDCMRWARESLERRGYQVQG